MFGKWPVLFLKSLIYQYFQWSTNLSLYTLIYMKKICPFFCLYSIYKYIYIFYHAVYLYKRALSRTLLDNALLYYSAVTEVSAFDLSSCFFEWPFLWCLLFPLSPLMIVTIGIITGCRPVRSYKSFCSRLTIVRFKIRRSIFL